MQESFTGLFFECREKNRPSDRVVLILRTFRWMLWLKYELETLSKRPTKEWACSGATAIKSRYFRSIQAIEITQRTVAFTYARPHRYGTPKRDFHFQKEPWSGRDKGRGHCRQQVRSQGAIVLYLPTVKLISACYYATVIALLVY